MRYPKLFINLPKYIYCLKARPACTFYCNKSILQQNNFNESLEKFGSNSHFHTKSSSSSSFDVDALFKDISFEKEDFKNSNYFERRPKSYGQHLDDETFTSLEDLKKNIYEEVVIESSTNLDENREFLDEHSVSIDGNFDKPFITEFSQMNLPKNISEKIRRLKFEKPTPIQSIAWPIAFSGKDVVGIAQTGSGKTLSFILPALLHIERLRNVSCEYGPIALVVCPTRELANQCEQVVKSVSRNVRVTSIYGGASRTRQLYKIRGSQIIIATPGRLIDFLNTKDISLRSCSYLVLDEADRMLDMGFENDVRTIVGQIRPDRQFTMWSATWPNSIQNLANSYLNSEDKHIQIKVGSSELTANKNVEQSFEIAHSNSKFKIFVEFLQNESTKLTKEPKMIVFLNTKRGCENLQRDLNRSGIRGALTLHGDKSQSERDRIMNAFKMNYTNILIATDVASRGLDVSDIDYVINYDLPSNCYDYIHRIGRTGRAGKSGKAFSILTETDGALVSDLIQNLKNVQQQVDEKLFSMQEWHQRNKSSKRKPRNSYSYGGGYRRINSYERNYHQTDYNDRRYNRNYQGKNYGKSNRYSTSRGFEDDY